MSATKFEEETINTTNDNEDESVTRETRKNYFQRFNATIGRGFRAAVSSTIFSTPVKHSSHDNNMNHAANNNPTSPRAPAVNIYEPREVDHADKPTINRAGPRAPAVNVFF